MTTAPTETRQPAATGDAAPQRGRMLGVVCANHALHDGYTDTLYVLLPFWQAEFGLSYAAVGFLRAVYSGVMAAFQVPASALEKRFGGPLLLALGTAIAACGYLLAGASLGLPLLIAGLVVAGIGSSTQHPIGSDLVASAFPGAASRPALGTYNFAGDVGKVALPAAAALLLTVISWRQTAFLVGALGLLSAALILLLLPNRRVRPPMPAAAIAERPAHAPLFAVDGFGTLLAIGMVDSATRMGFITFLPFLLAAKGASLAASGLALSLIFAGGAFGKLGCGFLGARLGITRTIVATKGLTAIVIAGLLLVPLGGALALLPLLGMMLNGTSSVLYGSVPDFAAEGNRPRAFGVFYTVTIGAGAAAPILFGLLTDRLGLAQMLLVLSGVALLTLPLALLLRGAARRKGLAL